MPMIDTPARDDYPFIADAAPADEGGPQGKMIASFNWLPGPVLIQDHTTWEIVQGEPVIRLTFGSPEALEAARLSLLNGPQGVMDTLDHELQMDLLKSQMKEAYSSVFRAYQRYQFIVQVCQRHMQNFVTPTYRRQNRWQAFRRRIAYGLARVLYPQQDLFAKCVMEELDGRLWREAVKADAEVRTIS